MDPTRNPTASLGNYPPSRDVGAEGIAPQIASPIGNPPPMGTLPPLAPSSIEKHDDYGDTSVSFEGHPDGEGSHRGLLGNEPGLQPLPRARMPGDYQGARRSRTVDSVGKKEVDWIVPIADKAGRRNFAERLEPTVKVARLEKEKYEVKAKMTGYALNIAIGLQVLLGSLTTGLSALATTGKSMAVPTTVLGALATLVASYLARARGSNEPELSITRVKDLEQFIRECESFQMDKGHVVGHDLDKELNRLRNRFEELLGNANGERRLSSV